MGEVGKKKGILLEMAFKRGSRTEGTAKTSSTHEGRRRKSKKQKSDSRSGRRKRRSAISKSLQTGRGCVSVSLRIFAGPLGRGKTVRQRRGLGLGPRSQQTGSAETPSRRQKGVTIAKRLRVRGKRMKRSQEIRAKPEIAARGRFVKNQRTRKESGPAATSKEIERDELATVRIRKEKKVETIFPGGG